jgi:hypothetical protein
MQVAGVEIEAGCEGRVGAGEKEKKTKPMTPRFHAASLAMGCNGSMDSVWGKP